MKTFNYCWISDLLWCFKIRKANRYKHLSYNHTKPYSKNKLVDLLQTSDEVLERSVEAALEAGYRHFDTARAYENEAALGRALNRWIGGDPAKRKELFIVTKLPPGGILLKWLSFNIISKKQKNEIDL